MPLYAFAAFTDCSTRFGSCAAANSTFVAGWALQATALVAEILVLWLEGGLRERPLRSAAVIALTVLLIGIATVALTENAMPPSV
jgi:hypothetical protein